jgi:hypothetical protein
MRLETSFGLGLSIRAPGQLERNAIDSAGDSLGSRSRFDKIRAWPGTSLRDPEPREANAFRVKCPSI